MSNIRELDLSWNSMPSPPHNVWYILPYLAFLSLSYNPITSIKNESFLSLDRLQRIDLGGLELANVEVIKKPRTDLIFKIFCRQISKNISKYQLILY